jgi:hypothetical protein
MIAMMMKQDKQREASESERVEKVVLNLLLPWSLPPRILC